MRMDVSGVCGLWRPVAGRAVWQSSLRGLRGAQGCPLWPLIKAQKVTR